MSLLRASGAGPERPHACKFCDTRVNCEMCTVLPAFLQIISGGEEGMVRVWRIGRDSQVLEASMKDHKGSVNSIQVGVSTCHRPVSVLVLQSQVVASPCTACKL